MKDYVKNNENNEKIMKGYVKNNVLKQFNNFKNYRYDFFIFSIFRFSIMFPVVVPRCSARCSTPGGWVEVLEPDLFIIFSLFSLFFP